jgi:hypothetical protein
MPNNFKEHPLDSNAVRLWERRGTTHKLFRSMDKLGGVQKLVRDTQSEIDETKAELDAPIFDEKAGEAEWVDGVNVLTATALHTNRKIIKPSEYLYGVNGEGKHSNIFEKLEERVADIQDTPKAIPEVYQLLWSLRVHQINPDQAALFATFVKADEKFRGNYPSRYYSGIDVLTGQKIAEEYQEQAFTHFTKALKMIRKKVNRILQESDYLPYDHFIVDWRNSETALQQLQLTLESMPQVENGIAVLGNEIAVPSQEFTRHIDHTKNRGILFQHSK